MLPLTGREFYNRTASGNGYWGPVTATLDWCESNYEISHYFCEFYNSLTNMVFILLALYLLRTCFKYGFETRFIMATLSYLLIGVGSLFFHATLAFHFQMMDELPMVYLLLVFVYILWETGPTDKYPWLPYMLLLSSAAFTSSYLILLSNYPAFHEAIHGSLVALALGRGIYMVEKKMDAVSFEATQPVQKKNSYKTPRVLTLKQRSDLRYLLYGSLSMYLFGFTFWVMDNILCQHLLALRSHPQFGIAHFLFEFHALWHILSGIAAYAQVLFLIYLRCCLLWKTGLNVVKDNGVDLALEIEWGAGFFPYITVNYSSYQNENGHEGSVAVRREFARFFRHWNGK